jgi:hypothetical protein
MLAEDLSMLPLSTSASSRWAIPLINPAKISGSLSNEHYFRMHTFFSYLRYVGL